MTDKTIETPLLAASGISKIYSQGAMAVGLHRFSAEFWRGEFVAITGSSGSGKSTLLNLLSGLDSYDEGELYFMGEPTSHYTEEDRAAYRKDNVAFIFQDYYLLDSYTVYQNIELALLYTMPDPKERDKRVKELMEAVGLTGHAKQRCSQLSGGQKQRVSIARALAKDAPILFADEPCGNLDSTMTEEVMRLLYELSRDKLVLIVTHSFDEVAPYATRKIRLADGELVEDLIIHNVKEPCQEVHSATITKKQFALGLTRVALNNIKATPKRSFFGIFGLAVLTAIFIIGLLLTTSVVELPIINDGNYRYDLQVIRKDRADITNAEMTNEIGQTDGVLRAFRDSDLIHRYFPLDHRAESYNYYYLRPACNLKTEDLYQGRKPTDKSEAVICLPASRRYLNFDLIGTQLKSHDYGIQGDILFNFTIVGIVLGDDDIVYCDDALFEDEQYLVGVNNAEVVVTCANELDMIRARNALIKKGYTVYHLYGDHMAQSTSQMIQWVIAASLFAAMLLVFRIITGSYRALETSKRRDYNIMRTVGLPNIFVKSIYYVEMGLQGLIGWAGGVVITIIVGLIYGFVITPSVTYGFKMMAQYGVDLLWVGAVALAADLYVTIGNAIRFNRYFYRQTVKMSLKEGVKHD